jgi:hypothetical protein
MPMDCLVTRASTTTSSTSQWNRAMPNGLVSIGKKRMKTLLLFFEELAKMEPKLLQMTVPERDNFSESNWIERREKTREAKNPITMRKPKLPTN